MMIYGVINMEAKVGDGAETWIPDVANLPVLNCQCALAALEEIGSRKRIIIVFSNMRMPLAKAVAMAVGKQPLAKAMATAIATGGHSHGVWERPWQPMAMPVCAMAMPGCPCLVPPLGYEIDVAM